MYICHISVSLVRVQNCGVATITVKQISLTSNGKYKNFTICMKMKTDAIHVKTHLVGLASFHVSFS